MNTSAITFSPAAGSVREVRHGIEVEDPFRWLEDQDSPATRAFIGTEQKAYREYLDRHKELRRRIESRVRELLTVPGVDLPVPDHRGGLLYLKREAREEQKAIYRQDDRNSEMLLISIAMLGRDTNASLAIIQVSPDGHYLLFALRTGGEDVQELGLYELVERRLMPDRLPRGFLRGLVFDDKQDAFYYVHEEAEGRYQQRRAVRRHEFGTNPCDDVEIFHAGEGPGMRLIVRGAEDGSSLGYLIVSLESVPQTRFLIHEFPLNAAPQEIVHLSGASFGPRFWAHAIEASTTYAASRGRIVKISLDHPEPEAWSDLIPEASESLSSWERWADLQVVHYTAGSFKRTRLYTPTGTLVRTIEYPASGTCTIGQVDGSAHRLFYSYSDIASHPAIHAVDLRTGDHRVWWQPPNPIGQTSFDIELDAFRSIDGTEVPITLIHPRGTEGIRPVLLSAYGGSGVSATPKFSALLTILVEAGFTCATAHVRGGGEGGIEWHLAAQKQHKQNSVDDLLQASRWLIAKGYTTAEHLGVAGQSNGALLTLCAVTQQPGLFRAALALGPITDLTRFHLFGVARGSVTELGSPDDPAEFGALFRLSPYHQVRKEVAYPAVLIISGDRDKRCDALHARKMIAQLKSQTLQSRPILLDYTEMRGHKPVLPLTERIRALSDRLTFLIAELGVPSREVLS